MWGIGYDGIGVRTLAVLIAAAIGAADEGKVVCVSANDTVDLCDAEDNFCAVLKKVEADSRMPAGTIQTKGFVTLSYTGNPGLGFQELVADGDGGVKPPAAAVKAALVTGVVGNNNALAWAARISGDEGNDISLALLDPAGNDKALAVDVVGRDILVSLATGGAGAITSTAAEVIAAVEASAANDLVTVDNSGASTGAAAVVAVALTDLAGGADASVGRKLHVWNKDTVAGTLVVDLG